MTIAIKPTASGSTIEQNGSTILTVDGSGNITPSNDLYPKVPAFRAYKSASTQAITSQVWTKVVLDEESFDTSSEFDSTTNYRFTPSVAGYYHVSCSVRAIDLEQQIAGLYKNGSIYSYGSYIQNCVISKHTDLVYLNGTTDYIEMFYFATTAATVNTGSVNTYFTAHLVSV